MEAQTLLPPLLQDHLLLSAVFKQGPGELHCHNLQLLVDWLVDALKYTVYAVVHLTSYSFKHVGHIVVTTQKAVFMN